MFHRINLPTASDITVNWGKEPSWESDLPISVFEGDTIHVFANFDSPITKTPTLSFKQGSQSFEIQAEEIHAGSPELPRLAASTKMIGATNFTKLGLALLYQLVSDQTNYLLVHERAEEDKATELPELQKIQQMQAAGWGGINSVSNSSINHYSMARMDNISPPKLFRMHSSSFADSFDSSMDSYEIDHSKVYDSIESYEPPPKAITPREMIEQASMIIDHESNLTEFVEAMECERMDPELEFCLNYLQNRCTPEMMWAMILGWLLIRVEGAKWNPKTKQVIEGYIEDLDNPLVPDSFEMLANRLGTITLLSWSDY
jgi:Ca-activated chloride channel family protein